MYLRVACLVFFNVVLSACVTTSDHSKTASEHNSSPSGFRFSVIGDLPYNKTQEYSLKRFITPALSGSEFVIHLGDFKTGSGSTCSQERDSAHGEWMNSVGVPVFYTPGDNDWADCDRQANAPVVRETLRLEQIRQRLFPPTAPVSDGWNIERQTSAPENASWKFGDVRFSTVHVIGGNNGRDTFEPCIGNSVCDTPNDIAKLVATREKQALDWIAKAFDNALTDNAKAIVLAMHSDVYDVDFPDIDCKDTAQIECDGFKKIRSKIIERSAKFKRPVLIIHGDTSPYCWDRTMGGAKAPNLIRLNAAGDFVLIDAVHINVDMSVSDPFHAKGAISNLLPAENQCT